MSGLYTEGTNNEEKQGKVYQEGWERRELVIAKRKGLGRRPLAMRFCFFFLDLDSSYAGIHSRHVYIILIITKTSLNLRLSSAVKTQEITPTYPK